MCVHACVWNTQRCLYLGMWCCQAPIQLHRSSSSVLVLCIMGDWLGRAQDCSDCVAAENAESLQPPAKKATFFSFRLKLPLCWRTEGKANTSMGVLSLTWGRYQCSLWHHQGVVWKTVCFSACLLESEASKNIFFLKFSHFWASLLIGCRQAQIDAGKFD